MVFVNFVLFIVYIALASGGIKKFDTIEDSGYPAAEDISEVISATFSMVAAILFAVTFFLGFFSACCHSICYGCVGILVPWSLAAAILMIVLTGIVESNRTEF